MNRGLGRTRNDLVEAARGELSSCSMPTTRSIRPRSTAWRTRWTTIPGAFFAYPMLEELIDGEPHTLRSFSPWEPGRLAEANYIDAMSPLRRQELRELGGYTEDPRLLGWEDYDLWCRTRSIPPQGSSCLRSSRDTGERSTRCCTR